MEVWSGIVGDNEMGLVAVLFNRSSTQQKISIALPTLGLSLGNYHVRDLINHADLGQVRSIYTADVVSHGVVMVKFTAANGAKIIV